MRSGRWSSAARPRSASRLPTATRSPRANGEDLDEAAEVLVSARPTAVNLAVGSRADAAGRRRSRRAGARDIHRREVERCRRMGEHAAGLLRKGSTPLTHCNAGGLATGGYGSALGAVKSGYERGLVEHVFVDETRPLLQGGAADGVGARARRGSGQRNRGLRRGVAHGARRDHARDHRRRPDRRERRHGEQDRHVRSRRARLPSRHSVLRRRADLHARPRCRDRRGHPDRGARPGRGERALRGAEPRLRRHARGPDRRRS